MRLARACGKTKKQPGKFTLKHGNANRCRNQQASMYSEGRGEKSARCLKNKRDENQYGEKYSSFYTVIFFKLFNIIHISHP